MLFLRIKASLPVIIMGETGIGKTSLVKVLSYLMGGSLSIMNIHAGITE